MRNGISVVRVQRADVCVHVCISVVVMNNIYCVVSPSEGENGRLKIDVAENILSLLHFRCAGCWVV
jgi:hypothetical protein